MTSNQPPPQPPFSADASHLGHLPQIPQSIEPYATYPPPLAPTLAPANPRKRRLSGHDEPQQLYPTSTPSATGLPKLETSVTDSLDPDTSTSPPVAKKSRTNTPWTPAEEQRLKTMRDAVNSWSEIAKLCFEHGDGAGAACSSSG